MARTYKDLTDHAVDRVTGGREESYAQDRARRVRHMEAGGKLVRRNRLDRFGPEVLELISDGLCGEEEVETTFWMGGILDAIEKARRDA